MLSESTFRTDALLNFSISKLLRRISRTQRNARLPVFESATVRRDSANEPLENGIENDANTTARRHYRFSR